MLYYFVIGLCLALLILVIYFSIKPISMGIDARRNLTNNDTENKNGDDFQYNEPYEQKETQISEEIVKLSNLKKEGLITEEEFKKAKDKILN